MINHGIAIEIIICYVIVYFNMQMFLENIIKYYFDTNIFYKACIDGSTYIVKYYYKCFQKIDVTKGNNYLIRSLCRLGHLRMIKILLEHNPNIDIHVNNEEPFRNACKYGHINLVKYLLDKFSEIDVSIHDNESFRHACLNNHLDVAMFLFDKINGNINYKNLFIASYELGNVDMARWLSKVKPFVLDDSMFDKACIKNQINVAKTLCQIKPHYYYLIIENNIITNYGVMNKKERNWSNVKEMLIAHRNEENNIFYKTPLDVIKYICKYIIQTVKK